MTVCQIRFYPTNKDNAENYYCFSPEFYQSVLEDLPQNEQMFWAEKTGKVIATSMIVGANGYLDYHLSGSLIEYSTLVSTNLLLYKVALWGVRMDLVHYIWVVVDLAKTVYLSLREHSIREG